MTTLSFPRHFAGIQPQKLMPKDPIHSNESKQKGAIEELYVVIFRVDLYTL